MMLRLIFVCSLAIIGWGCSGAGVQVQPPEFVDGSLAIVQEPSGAWLIQTAVLGTWMGIELEFITIFSTATGVLEVCLDYGADKGPFCMPIELNQTRADEPEQEGVDI